MLRNTIAAVIHTEIRQFRRGRLFLVVVYYESRKPVSRGIKVKMGWFTVFTSRFSCVMNFVKGNEYSDGGVKMVSEVFRNMG